MSFARRLKIFRFGLVVSAPQSDEWERRLPASPMIPKFLHSHHAAFPTRIGVLLISLVAAMTLSAAGGPRRTYDIPAGDPLTTLKQFSEQSGTELLYSAAAVEGVTTAAVRGEFSAEEAIARMLKGTPLRAVQNEKSGGFTVTRVEGERDPNDPRVVLEKSSGHPSNPASRYETDASGDKVLKLETFEVFGRKTLNMDLPRSRDDALPYVVFDRQAISNSRAANLEDFLRRRLTMETTSLSESQTNSLLGARSSINLRGLGTNQTLLLVDGHRLASVMTVGSIYQPDVNGIPLEAIERIEVLPTSASGIYGGSATGGVINIILRRDYTGVEAKLTYSNTFDTDAATRRIDLSAGATLFNGRTNLLLAASASDGNRLLTQDRGLRERGVARILANYPAYFTSATYPPFGSTTNIKSSNGTNLVLKNGTPLNSPRTFVPAGYAGPATDQGAALVANAGQYNYDSAQTISSGLRPLLNAPEMQSLMLTVRHEFSESFQGFLELNGSNNTGRFSYVAMPSNFTLQADNPNNPFTQAIRILTPLYGINSELTSVSQDRRLVAGVIAKLPGEWKGELDTSFDRSRFTTVSYSSQGLANGAVASGALNLIRDTRAYPVDFSPYVDEADVQLPTHSKVLTVTARASGPIGHLPAGRPMVSALVENRREEFDPSIKLQGDFFSGSPEPQKQRVKSAYVEGVVPLVSPDFGLPFARSLELSVATRWDDYESEGTDYAIGSPTVTRARNSFDSLNPTIGLRYVATPSLMFRMSYGTGFLPPSITDLVPTSFDFFGFYTDPRRGNETLGSYTLLFGGNSDVGPERSTTWSGGVVITPAALPGLRMSVDWTRISKTDNITEPDPFDLLAYEDLFPGRIVRGPVPAGDPYGVGPIIRIDGSAINIAKAELESIDGSLDYTRETGFGRLDFFAQATVARHFRTRLLPSSPEVEHVGLATSQSIVAGGTGYPVRLRGNAGVVLSRGSVKLGWSVRYIDDYRIDATFLGSSILLAQGNEGRVDEQWYHDCFVSYDFDHGAFDSRPWGRLLAGTELRIGVQNVFNTEPPFDASNATTYYSGYGDPRLAAYTISLKRRF